MRKYFILFILIIPVFLSSCFKEDDKVAPHKPGNTLTDVIALTNTYKYLVYYSLSNHSATSTIDKNQFDLALESSPEGWHIRLNTSCFMYAADMGLKPFGQPVDTVHATWRFDNSNGHPDSTAIGNWYDIDGNDTIGNGHLFMINCGLDDRGIARGYRQFMIDSLKKGTYYFRTADFNGQNVKSYAVSKSSGTNQVFVTFGEATGKVNEPPGAQWDLVFGQYTTLLYTDIGEPYPYLVTGVLMNPGMTVAALDSIHSFDAINYEIASATNLESRQDAIGYDWKYYNFSNANYTVRERMNYIIRDQYGYFYKLRFTGYYSNTGEKGFPAIEYQRL